jgi:hypothetical protein
MVVIMAASFLPSVLPSTCQARKYIPSELPLVNFFGWTLGGFYLARYSCEILALLLASLCFGCIRGQRAPSCFAARFKPPPPRLFIHPLTRPSPTAAQPPPWAPLTSAWPWRALPGTGRRHVRGQLVCM